MAETELLVRLCNKSDTKINWETNNPILSCGEIGYDIDSKQIKIGDGENNWNNLEYVPLSSALSLLDENKADKQNSNGGFAGGEGASAGAGFAGGKEAKTQTSGGTPIDAVQLGTGTNNNEKTLQVYNYTLMNADGSIPSDRLGNVLTIDELERLQYYGDKNIVPSSESYFTVNATGETITGLTDTGKTQTGTLVIPYKINGVEITEIGIEYLDPTYSGEYNNFNKIVLPNTITSISDGAFWNCESITSINIPDSVTYIGSFAFSSTALTSINLPDGAAICEYAFQNCTSLTTISIPNINSSIDTNTFHGCTSLKSIEIPNSVTSIGDSAFSGCTSLTSIKIPNSVTTIGNDAFNGCTSLTSIEIPGSVIAISDSAFTGITPANLTVYCEQGSYAETYAKSKNIPIMYTDIDPSKYLTKDNTAEYTPTDDYQPATKKYVDNAIFSAMESISPEQHAAVFRGKNLGSAITDAQKAAIADGSFKDLFIGDYWVINNITWRIADMDYWYNTSKNALTRHHLVMIPDTCLFEHIMKNSGSADVPSTTKGGYHLTDMHREGMRKAQDIVIKAFGANMCVSHKEAFVNAVTNGKPSSFLFEDSWLDLPTEIMMYGTNIFAVASDGSTPPAVITYCRTQLALFDIAPKFIVSPRQTYWLRDIVSDGQYAAVNAGGYATHSGSEFSLGVRPVFCIG